MSAQRAWRIVLPYLASAAFVTASAFAATALLTAGVMSQVSIVFVVPVLASAILWGLIPSLFTVLVSVAAASFFFYAPLHSFAVHDLQDLVDLVVFVAVAVAASQLAAQSRAHTVEAKNRAAAMRRLFNFGQKLAGIREEYDLRRAIAEALSNLVGQRVVLFSLGVGTLLPVASDDREIPAALGEAARRNLDAPPMETAAGGTMPDGAAPPGWQLYPLHTVHAGPNLVAVELPKARRRAGSQTWFAELLRAKLDQAAIALDRLVLWSELEDARVDARADRLRDALINSISHDLKTPLAAVLGSATALQDPESKLGSDARTDLVATIREEAERLNDYVGNVMDLSRLRGGAIRPRLELTELADIVDAALRRARHVAAHEVVVDLPVDLPMLRLDLFLLQQALVNLLENAAKFSPAGSKITLSARVAAKNVEFDVTDTGLGIPQDELERVFDRFYRGVPAESGPAGSGLGLAICRAFVEANGGSVHAISPGGGKGATFRITLPIPDQTLALEAMLRDE